MSEVQKAFNKFCLVWGAYIIALILIAVFFCSCSGSRHVVKSSSKTDSLSIVKTETNKDSTVHQSTVSKTEETTDNDITTKDDYTEETTYYYGKDSSGGMPTVTHKKVKRTGTMTTTDKSKKKTNIDVQNDTKSHSSETKKEDNKTQVAKAESNKKVDSHHNVLSGSNFIMGAIGFIVFCGLIFLVWRWIKHKKAL